MAQGVKVRRRRRPRSSLTRNQVVEAALAVADEQGIEALTMPSLAHRLNCGVMTIYGYIDSKEELLGAIGQAGLRDLRLQPPLPPRAEDILIAWGRSLRKAFIAHPSLPAIYLSQQVIGSAILRGVEALLGRLNAAGMPPAAGVHAIYGVLIYTTGFLAWEIPRTIRQPQSAYAAGWRQEFAKLTPTELPLVSGVLSELGDVAGEAQFELGLAALAAGLTHG